jgi:hypothetical protein
VSLSRHVVAFALVLAAVAEPRAAVVVLDEDFADLGAWDDLSTAVSWGGHTSATSAFDVGGGVVRLQRSGPASTVGYTGYSGADDLKTFTALDHRFEAPIDHASNVVEIDFRARWDRLDSSGEKGRFMVVLTHDYPPGGLDLDLDDRFDDFDLEWWARPAYHVRLRSSGAASGQGTTLLQYGGGLTDLGEFEVYAGSVWLPGFVSGAGGVAPGTAPDFPSNSWVSTPTGLAATTWHDFRWVVAPDRQEIWWDEQGDGFEPEDLRATMPLPAHSGAPLYRWFETFEGVRLYWRGAGTPDAAGDPGQVALDWLRVEVTPLGGSPPAPTPRLPTLGTPAAALLVALLLTVAVRCGQIRSRSAWWIVSVRKKVPEARASTLPCAFTTSPSA